MGTNPQPCPGADIEIGDVTLQAGDLEVGAVEIKNAATDDRALVDDATPATTAFGLAVREVPTTGTPTHTADQPVTAVDSTVLAANTARKSAVIQNTGAQPIRVAIGVAATATLGFKLAAGQPLNIDRPDIPTGAVHVIRDTTATADSTVAVFEVV